MAEIGTECLRRRVAALEAENAELRRARQVAVELEASRTALRASEARYRLVVESATDYAIFTMDLDRRVTGWNVGAEHVLGWAEAEIVGQSADVIFTPEDREAEAPEQEARDTVEAGRAEDVRWHVRRDGSRLWANGVMLPLRDDAGAVQGLLKILRDKTADKHAEDELRESEARLRRQRGFLDTLIRQAPVGISIAEAPSGRAVAMNDKARALVGHGEGGADVSRYRGYGAVHLDGRPYAVDDYPTVRALRRGEAVEREEVIYRVGGAGAGADVPTRRLEMSSAPVRDAPDAEHPAGRIVAAVTIIQDVEEQRRAEEALQRLNETLEAKVAERTRERDRTWRLTRDLLMVARQDTTVEAVNPAWTRVLGWTEAELLGRSFLDLAHPDDPRPALAEAEPFPNGRATVRFENRCRCRDGAYRWISWTAVPDEGRLYASGRDVSAEKEREAALARAEEQLRQAQKMEAVGQLTGGIAHDFNNMLQGVGGALELAQRRMERGRADEVGRHLDTAQRGVERAAALTRQLLAFARRQALEACPVMMDDLVPEMAELARRTVGPAVEVRTRLGDGAWPVLCDANQLESALLNLAINARDAMPDGGTLTLATADLQLAAADLRGHEGVRPGDYVEVAVSDTGTGMTSEVASRAFEPFFTTKPFGQGTGLGLSQLYGFVQQSGGLVHLDSQLGRGTTVRLLLPRHEGDEAVPQAGTPEQEQEQAWTGAGGTVLVVEDEATVRALVAETLRELGCRVLEAEDGPAALRLLHGGARVDLLVTDVGLPGMNGRQVAEAAREQRPRLPVLFVTGYAGGALEEHLAPGMAVIGKPFALDALAAKVRSMIGGEGSLRA